MRLFIAANISERTKALLERKVNKLIDSVNQELKWVNSDNWHLTLKFLGDVASNKVDSIQKIMTRVSGNYYEFPSLFKNIGAFPHLNHPQVIYIDIDRGKKQLQQINHELEQLLVEKGFETDDREYNPHLTIARSRSNTDLKQLARSLKNFKKPHFLNVHMKTENMSLIKSELHPEGPVYKKIFNISLKSNTRSDN